MKDDTIVRVLAIPPGAVLDASGRGIGDDWLLFEVGEGDDGTTYYVTTDRVRCSEIPVGLDDPKMLAERIVELLNMNYRGEIKVPHGKGA